MEEEEEQLAVMAGETYGKLDKVISSMLFNDFQISIFRCASISWIHVGE